MARIQIEKEPADPEVKRLYAEMVAGGFGTDAPNNFLSSLSARPDLLEATWRLTKTVLVDGKLPDAIKQMISLSIARQNGCRYCAAIHRGVLESVGVDENIINAVAEHNTHELEEPHRSIVNFALKPARAPASMTDKDFAGLRDLGLADEEIAEVVMMAAYANFLNAYADICDIPLEGTE